MIAVNLNCIETLPNYDVTSTLIYAASRSQVTDVWVAGNTLMRNRQLTTIDETELLEKVDDWHEKIKPVHQPTKQSGVK